MNDTLRKMFKKELPSEANWKTVTEWEKYFTERKLNIAHSYTHCLIACEKHGDDIEILFGALQPKNDYKDYEYVYYNVSAHSAEPRILDKEDIIAISFLPDFYWMIPL